LLKTIKTNLQSAFNLKTIFLRVLPRVKQTRASIKILIGIGKQGRRIVVNQSWSVLQPFLLCVNQNNGVNDTCLINKRALRSNLTRVLIAIRGLSS